MTELPFEVPAESPNPITPSSYDAVLAVLDARDREFAAKEVADLLHEHYGMDRRTVNAALWRLSEQGRVTRVGRGVYRAKKEDTDE